MIEELVADCEVRNHTNAAWAKRGVKQYFYVKDQGSTKTRERGQSHGDTRSAKVEFDDQDDQANVLTDSLDTAFDKDGIGMAPPTKKLKALKDKEKEVKAEKEAKDDYTLPCTLNQ